MLPPQHDLVCTAPLGLDVKSGFEHADESFCIHRTENSAHPRARQYRIFDFKLHSIVAVK
jgi:hypothetical protein